MSTYGPQRAGDAAAYRASQPGPRLTPYQARLLARNARQYPEVPAGIHVGAVMIPEEVQPQVLEAANARAQESVESKPKKRKRGGLLGFAQDTIGAAAGAVSDVADFVTPEVVEDAVGFTLGEFSDSFKNIGRPAFAALESPLQFVTGAARQVYGAATGSYDPSGNPLDFVADAFEQTTVGQALLDWTSGRGVDLGSGFFPGGPTVERRQERERATAQIGNSAWTPGRWLAVDVLKADQGSLAYNIASGTIDAGIAIFGDPANIGLDKLADGMRAARAGTTVVGPEAVAKAAAKADPAWREMVDEAIGLIPSTYKEPRQSVLVSQAAKWLYSDDGRKVVTELAANKSATDIWRASGKKYPLRLAQALADTDDPVQVANLLVDAMTRDVREIPHLSLADRVVKNRQEHGRLWNLMPSTMIDPDDPETAFRNIDATLANSNIHGEKRREILDQAARALTGDSRQARFEMLKVVESALHAQLVEHGLPEELAERMTQFTRQMNDVARYGLDRHGMGVEFMPGDEGPLMVSQLLGRVYFLYDPRLIRQVREQTINNRVLRFIANNPWWRAPNSLVASLQTEMWKPGTLIRPAYLTKVIGEETGRVLMGARFDNPLDYLLTMFGHRRQVRVTGEEWTSIADRADALIAERKVFQQQLKLKDPAARDEAKQALDEIAAELANLNDEAIRKVDDYSAALNRTLPNQLFDEAGYERLVQQQIRMGAMQTANKFQDPQRWVDGNAEAILLMRTDPVAQRVANGGLFDGDSVDDARQGLDGVVDWLLRGAGQKFLQEFVEGNPGHTREQVAMAMVHRLADNILYRTGNDQRLLEAIAKGTIDGEDIGVYSRVTKSVPSRRLRKVLNEVRENNPDVSPFTLVRSEIVETAGGGSDLARWKAWRDRAVGWFFQDMYGKYSDRINRIPAFKSFYYDQAEQLVAHMDPGEAKKLVANAEEALGKGQAQRLRELAEMAAGDLTVEDVDKLAGHAALDETVKLLFNPQNRTQLFDVIRVLAPFGEAWREILTSYSRLLTKNPRTIRRFQQGVNALRGSGWMHTNEQGQEVITIPLSGELVSILTGGAVNADMEMGVESLSIGTQVIPGLGPTASFLADKFIPDEPGADWARRLLFPYGPPEDLNLLPVPAWLSKIAQGAGWVDGQTAKSTKEQVLNLLAATGQYGPGDRDRLLADADRVTRGILFARGLTQAVAPAAPMVRYVAETPAGNVPAAQITEEYRKIADEEGYEAAIFEMFDRYGMGIAEILTPQTETTVAGLEASRAFGNFERENPWLFDEHPEIAGFFGPHEDGFDYQTYLRQIERGQRRRLSTNDRLAAANQLRGDAIVAAQIAKMPPRTEWGDLERAYLRQLKEELAAELPGYTPYVSIDVNKTKRQVDSLVRAASDPRLADNPVARAIRVYAGARDEAIARARAMGRASFTESQDTAVLREWLSFVGAELVAQVPGFARVWDRLLSREVETDGN